MKWSTWFDIPINCWSIVSCIFPHLWTLKIHWVIFHISMNSDSVHGVWKSQKTLIQRCESEASYVYILSGQKLIKNSINGTWRVPKLKNSSETFEWFSNNIHALKKKPRNVGKFTNFPEIVICEGRRKLFVTIDCISPGHPSLPLNF